MFLDARTLANQRAGAAYREKLTQQLQWVDHRDVHALGKLVEQLFHVAKKRSVPTWQIAAGQQPFVVRRQIHQRNAWCTFALDPRACGKEDYLARLQACCQRLQ